MLSQQRRQEAELYDTRRFQDELPTVLPNLEGAIIQYFSPSEGVHHSGIVRGYRIDRNKLFASFSLGPEVMHLEESSRGEVMKNFDNKIFDKTSYKDMEERRFPSGEAGEYIIIYKTK